MKLSYKALPIFLLALSASFVSCEKIDLDGIQTTQTGSQSNGKAHSLKVLTSTGELSEMRYPLSVYAFDAEGNLAGQQTIGSSSEALTLPLTAGNYNVVAISHTEGISLPSSPNRTTKITVGTQSQDCLLIGNAVVTMGVKTASVDIKMGIKSAETQFVLEDIPSDATEVYVNVSNLATYMDFSGAVSGTTIAKIPLKKSGTSGKWQSDKAYLLPGTEANTVFTVSIVRPDNTESYSYTHPGTLKGGTPYVITGTYNTDGGMSLTGSFVPATWANTVYINFSMGESSGGTIDGGGGTSSGGEVVEVPSGLQPGGLWDGHVIALVKPVSETETELTLLSLEEWEDVVSAKNASNPSQAADIASAYREDGLGGWTIPTKDQAKALKELYDGADMSAGNMYDVINNTLNSLGKESVKYFYSYMSGDNSRYLCEDATYTYHFGKTVSVTQAGANVKYRLRLVKTIKAKVK